MVPKPVTPRKFESFKEFREAFKKRVAHAVRLLVVALHAIEIAHRELVPLPFQSLFVEDCIEKGLDLHSGGTRYNFMGIQAVGLAKLQIL